MSVVASIRRIVDDLEADGFRVVFIPHWEKRGIGEFGKIIGQLNHHDAFPKSTGHAGGLRTCTFGRPDLRNSLCMFYVGSDGTIYVVAAKVSWHAGAVDRGSNSSLSGIEARNNGTGEPWPEVQLRAYAALNAACAEEWEYSVSMVRDHKEAAVPRGRKIDRHGINPDSWRNRVRALLESGGDEVFASYVMFGDQRPEVTDWQITMNEILPDDKKIVVDGKYGPATQAAVAYLTKSRGKQINPRQAVKIRRQYIKAVMADHTHKATAPAGPVPDHSHSVSVQDAPARVTVGAVKR